MNRRGADQTPLLAVATATISRNGDLVHRMYLEIFGTTRATINNPMSAIITDVELEIGGQKIDKHSGLWMEVWTELTEKNSTGGCADWFNIISKNVGHGWILWSYSHQSS